MGVGARNGAPKETITEGTAAWAWRATSFTTLEQGFTYKSDGSWEIILGWQYSFAGN